LSARTLPPIRGEKENLYPFYHILAERGKKKREKEEKDATFKTIFWGEITRRVKEGAQGARPPYKFYLLTR